MSVIAGCFYYSPQQEGFLSYKISEISEGMDAKAKKAACFYSDDKQIAFGHLKTDAVNSAAMHEDKDYVVCFKGRLSWDKDEALPHGVSAGAAAKLLLKEFREKGEKLPGLLEGIYCCIILDKRQKRLWIFTDRGGYEFVYYYADNCRFIFATDIKPVLRLVGHPPEVDMDGICNMYVFNAVFNTGTPFKYIKLMPHAVLCSVGTGGADIRQYWNYPIHVEHHEQNGTELLRASQGLIQSAVDQALEGYEHIGVMLSAGLDSRLLASVATGSKGDMTAFTFHHGEAKFFEDDLAREIASQLNLKFRVVSCPVHPVDEIERCILDTDGQWGFHDLLPCMRQIGEQAPGIGLINGFLMDTLFKSSWAFFPGNIPEDMESALAKRYSATGDYLIDKLFHRAFADCIKESRKHTIQETIGDLPEDRPTEVSLRFYFVNRGRRAHNNAFKAFRKYLDIILPGTNYSLTDFALKLPYPIRSSPDFYLDLICRWFPEVAQVPWDKTGKPLTEGVVSKNPKKEQYLFKIQYYFQRLSRGRFDFLNSESGFNWKLRNDRKFRASIKEILFDERTLSRGFFSRKAMDAVFKEHLAGKDYAVLFKAVISVEMLFRKFIDSDSREF